jgi:hypothetical protein
MDRQPPKQDVAITEATGLLFYDGGLGWGGLFKDYAPFHNRDVARTLSAGSPEVTAKIVLLEDLPQLPGNWFDASAPGGDPHPIRFVSAESTDLSKDLSEVDPAPKWPEVTNTPTEGVVWTDLVLDRAGHIREPFSPISDNPAINGAAKSYFASLQFKPVLSDGQPAQVVRHVVLRFHLKRPAGVEDLGTAGAAFEHGRTASTLSASAKAPYVLTAKFSINLPSGPVEGSYADTWQDATHWRREVTMGQSRVVRSCDSGQQYLLSDGPQARLARIILTLVEPIPATDTFTESDWTLQRDSTMGNALLVLRGRKDPDQPLDPARTSGFWFDSSGRLVQAYAATLAVSYSDYQPFGAGQEPRSIVGRVKPGGGVALRIEVGPPEPLDPAAVKKDTFRIRGHEWKRQFTAEVR